MKGKESKCAAVRLEKSRLMAAMAILAVAFVVLAAVPVALTDSDAAATTYPTSDPLTGMYGDTSENINYSAGTYTLSNAVTVTLTKSVDISQVKFAGSGALTITSAANEIYTLTINYDSGSNGSDNVFADDVIVDGANLVVTQTGTSESVTGKIIKDNEPLTAENGATVTLNGGQYAPALSLGALTIDATSTVDLEMYNGFSASSYDMVTGSTLETSKWTGSATIPYGNLKIGQIASGVLTVQDVTIAKSMSVAPGATLKIDTAKTLTIGENVALTFEEDSQAQKISALDTAGANSKLQFNDGASLKIVKVNLTVDNTAQKNLEFRSSGKILMTMTDQVHNGVIGNAKIEDASTDGKSSLTITGCAPIQANKTMTIETTVNGSIALMKNSQVGKLLIKDKGSYSGTIESWEGSSQTWSKTASAKVTNLSGTETGLTLAAGSIILTGEMSAAEAQMKIEQEGHGDVQLGSGFKLISGTLELKGTIKVTENIEIGKATGDEATLKIAEGAELVVTNTKKITVNRQGTLEVDGAIKNATLGNKVTVDGSGQVTVGTAGDISAVTAADSIEVVVDPSRMSEMTVSGETSSTSTTYTAIQTVTVSKYWTLVSGATVIVEGKLVVPAGTVLTIEKNAKLVLRSGATAEIEGSVVIESRDSSDAASILDGILQVGNKSTLTIEGSVDVEGKLKADNGSNIAVEQDASLLIAEDGTLEVDSVSTAEIVVEASGTMQINGKTVQSATIQNYGLVTIDSDAAVAADQTVKLMADGAIVDVVKFTVDAHKSLNGNTRAAKLVITDFGLQATSYRENGETKYVTIEATTESTKADTITIQPAYDGEITSIEAGKVYLSFTGLTVTVSVSSSSTDKANSTDKVYDDGIYNGKKYSKTMSVSGSFDASIGKIDSSFATDIGANAAEATVSFDNEASSTFTQVGIKVSGSISIADNITVANATGKLSVTGTIVTASKDAHFTNVAAVEVTGSGEISIVREKIDSESGVSAARYETSAKDTSGATVKTYHYVSIDAAIAAADGTDVKEIVAIGTTTVKKTAAIATGVTLTGQSNATVRIGTSTSTDVVLTVAEGATVKGSFKEITVYGTLFVENKKNVSVTSIVSDVYSEEIGEDGKAVKDGWAQWTNLASAIASGVDTITISKAQGDDTYVKIVSNLTIPSDVTVIVPDDKAPLWLADGVTLTIDGTLKTSGDITAETRFAVNALDIESTDVKSSAVVVNGTLMVADTLNLAIGGGSTAGTTNAKSFVTSAPVYGAMYSIDNWDVVTTIDAALNETDITSGSIDVYGPVTGSDGTLTANDDLSCIVVKKTTFTPVNGGTAVSTSLTMTSLTLGDGAYIDMTGSFNGTVLVGENSVEFTDISGVYARNADDAFALYGTAALGTGKGLSISAGTVSLGYRTTAGTTSFAQTETYATYYPMTVASGATAEVVSVTNIADITVNGTLEVPAGASLTVDYMTVYGSVSTATSTATTAAGSLTVDDAAYIGMNLYDYKAYSTAASASVAGPLTLDSGAIMTVLSSASVEQDMTGYKTTAFYNGGSLWFTAYSNGYVNITVDKAPVTNAVLSGWATTEGGEEITSGSSSVMTFSIGYYPALYSVVDTKIYTIVVLADEGIADIYLNGNIMTYVNYGFIAYTDDVAAGTYTVKYTLKNGYSGEAKLALVDSEGATASVSGTSVTVSGDQGSVKLQLTGIEKSGYVQPTEEKDDSGLTVTDYLLIVLVILVVILAVIVAMRLMRS